MASFIYVSNFIHEVIPLTSVELLMGAGGAWRTGFLEYKFRDC